MLEQLAAASFTPEGASATAVAAASPAKAAVSLRERMALAAALHEDRMARSLHHEAVAAGAAAAGDPAAGEVFE